MKESRFRASIVIEEEIKKSSNYKTALEHLRNVFGDAMYEDALRQFARKVISDHLSQGQPEERPITNLIERFLKSLKKEPADLWGRGSTGWYSITS